MEKSKLTCSESVFKYILVIYVSIYLQKYNVRGLFPFLCVCRGAIAWSCDPRWSGRYLSLLPGQGPLKGLQGDLQLQRTKVRGGSLVKVTERVLNQVSSAPVSCLPTMCQKSRLIQVISIEVHLGLQTFLSQRKMLTWMQDLLSLKCLHLHQGAQLPLKF